MLNRIPALSALALFAFASPALAAPSSQITSPADPVYSFLGATTTVGDNTTVAGTATGMPGNVDIVCYPTYGNSPQELADNVAVSSGHFSATVDLTNVPWSCILRAVPHGTSPTAAERASFAGPRVLPSSFQAYNTPSGELNDYVYQLPSTHGNFLVDAPGDQG